MLGKDHAAYACIIDDEDSSETDSGALSIKFIPGLGPLFSPEETRSYSGYKAYKLGNGMQATIVGDGAEVYFQCELKDRQRPLSVTGNIDSGFYMSFEARFQPLFRSSLKVARSLGCENDINFPNPTKMKPLPLRKG
ncbi:hypothetical protein ACFV19_20945 [Streptomyces griseoluteus]|uniref:hypothetical protein n=1 Tax=Streptomyces griseoluteus TaxID=29306 RepID=UPI0036B4603A